MTSRTSRFPWAAMVGVVVLNAVFATIAAARGWPGYVLLFFLVAVWVTVVVAYRDGLREITPRQFAVTGVVMIALAAGLVALASLLSGASAIVGAFVLIVALAALAKFAVARS